MEDNWVGRVRRGVFGRASRWLVVGLVGFLSSNPLRATGELPNPYGNKVWYLAEGGRQYRGLIPNLHGDIDTYYSISNPNAVAVTVCSRYTELDASLGTYPDGIPDNVWLPDCFSIPATSTHRIALSSIIGGDYSTEGVAAVFVSQTPYAEIYPAQSTYSKGGWDEGRGFGSNVYSSWEGSHGDVATAVPRTQWMFAEGGAANRYSPPNRDPHFQWAYKIYNPNNAHMWVSLTFFGDGLWPPTCAPTRVLLYPYQTRQVRIAPDIFQPCGWRDINVEFASIVAASSETPYPFVVSVTNQTIHGATPYWSTSAITTLGTDSSRDWYFPEANNGGGCTGAEWHPRYYLFNPNYGAITVTLKFHEASAGYMGGSDKTVTVRARERTSVDGQYSSGMPCGAYSVHATSDSYFAMTKVQYWGRSFQWIEGVGSTGSSQLAYRWEMPTGSTKYWYPYGPGSRLTVYPYDFDMWLDTYYNVFSPNGPSTIKVTYQRVGAAPVVNYHAIPAGGRADVRAVSGAGNNQDFSATIEVIEGHPVSAEYNMYFNMQYWSGSWVPAYKFLWAAAEGGPGIIP